jgi:hypothetical protein
VEAASPLSHEILPAVSARVDEGVLGPDAAKLRGVRRRTWVLNQMVLGSLSGLLRVLGDAGVDPIVVKGARLVSDVYPEPGTRPMADADVVVGPESFDLGLAALRSSGWTVKGDWTHAADLVDPRGSGADLHRWVMFPRFCRTPEQEWFDAAAQGPFLDSQARRLALHDELVLAIAHGLLTSSPSSVRWPLDVTYIVDAVPHADRRLFWERVSRSAQQRGVAPVVGDGLALCVEEFHAEVPPTTVATMRGQSLDPWLRYQWAWRRAGRFPPMRLRRYVDLERASGGEPTAWGYAEARWQSLQEHGPRRVISYRTRRLRRSVERRARPGGRQPA